jgi:predicted RecA/RadA family phage recombinase
MAKPTEILDAVRSCRNETGSTIVAGAVVIIGDVTAIAKSIILPAAATSVVYGVALNDILDDAWGDVCIRGIVKCNAEGALATKGVRVMPTTAGRVDAHTGANTVVGTLLTEASAQDDVVMVELVGPGAAGI